MGVRETSEGGKTKHEDAKIRKEGEGVNAHRMGDGGVRRERERWGRRGHW